MVATRAWHACWNPRSGTGWRFVRDRVKTDALERSRPQLERYEALCRELGTPPEQVALAWILAQPGVTSPIVGPVTLEQLDAAVKAIDVHLDKEVLAKLDDIFPGYKSAPEDYAW